MTHIALIAFLNNSINIRLLAAYLKSNGYKVTCFFCEGPFNGRNLKELIRIFKDEKIDLAGISLVTDNFRFAVQVTEAVKKELSIPVIWGGAHVNVMPEESLRYADMICMGEGEEALLELVGNISRNKHDTMVKNIWFRKDEVVIRNELRRLEENLDRYPFPDFDLDTQYFMTPQGFVSAKTRIKVPEYSLMTSRGCPYRCSYCYNSYRWKNYSGKGKYVRTRSVENVIEELVYAKQLFHGIEKINIWDDSFLMRDISDLKKFAELYIDKINIPFFIMAEPMAFNEEKIRVLKGCGLSQMQIGIQSGSERVNRLIYRRAISNKNVLDIARIVHQLEIQVKYDLIFNNPYESGEDLLETVGLLRRFPKPFFLQGYNLIFYPGTEITEKALKDGHISLKIDMEDFSTIQGRNNSPISSNTSGVVSSRFYNINYGTREKEYLNTIISTLGFKYVPEKFLDFIVKSETILNKKILHLLIKLYLALSGLKRFIVEKRYSQMKIKERKAVWKREKFLLQE